MDKEGGADTMSGPTAEGTGRTSSNKDAGPRTLLTIILCAHVPSPGFVYLQKIVSIFMHLYLLPLYPNLTNQLS